MIGEAECIAIRRWRLVDDNADVGVVTFRESNRILDGVFDPVGWHQTGKRSCHSTGTPGDL